MKKLLLFATFLVAGLCNAQTLEEESKKLDELISTAKSKREGTEKATAVVDIMLFGAKAKNPETSKKANEAVAELNNYATIDKITRDKNVILSKPISELSKEDLKGFKVEEDKFRSITFITPGHFGTSKYAYLSINEGLLNLRIVMEHHGYGWIFFNKVIILYNGKKLEYDAEKTETYVGKGYVTETSDVTCSPEMISAFREIVNTEKVDIRLSGENKVNDFEMSDKTKKNIKQALDLYDKLKK